MRRAAPPIPVSSKMLRHFAVLTIVITAGLAMFASGENRQALADTVERQQATSSVRQAEREKLGNHRKIGTNRPAPSSDGDAPVDSDGPADGGGYDPSQDSNSELQYFEWSGPRSHGSATGPGGAGQSDRPGPDAEHGPRSGLGGAKPGQKAKKGPTRPTRRQVEAMLAASRDRASRGGSASDDSDSE